MRSAASLWSALEANGGAATRCRRSNAVASTPLSATHATVYAARTQTPVVRPAPPRLSNHMIERAPSVRYRNGMNPPRKRNKPGIAWDGYTPPAAGTPKIVVNSTATTAPGIPNAVRSSKAIAAIAAMPSIAYNARPAVLDVPMPNTPTAIHVDSRLPSTTVAGDAGELREPELAFGDCQRRSGEPAPQDSELLTTGDVVRAQIHNARSQVAADGDRHGEVERGQAASCFGHEWLRRADRRLDGLGQYLGHVGGE
jgi:hypothetical protein